MDRSTRFSTSVPCDETLLLVACYIYDSDFKWIVSCFRTRKHWLHLALRSHILVKVTKLYCPPRNKQSCKDVLYASKSTLLCSWNISINNLLQFRDVYRKRILTVFERFKERFLLWRDNWLVVFHHIWDVEKFLDGTYSQKYDLNKWEHIRSQPVAQHRLRYKKASNEIRRPQRRHNWRVRTQNNAWKPASLPASVGVI